MLGCGLSVSVVGRWSFSPSVWFARSWAEVSLSLYGREGEIEREREREVDRKIERERGRSKDRERER